LLEVIVPRRSGLYKAKTLPFVPSTVVNQTWRNRVAKGAGASGRLHDPDLKTLQSAHCLLGGKTIWSGDGMSDVIEIDPIALKLCQPSAVSQLPSRNGMETVPCRRLHDAIFADRESSEGKAPLGHGASAQWPGYAEGPPSP
jgi:hypothetical protein